MRLLVVMSAGDDFSEHRLSFLFSFFLLLHVYCNQRVGFVRVRGP